MSEATAIREKEKAKNEGTLKDAQLGMSGHFSLSKNLSTRT